MAQIREAIYLEDIQSRILKYELAYQLRLNKLEWSSNEAKIEVFRIAEIQHLKEIWQREKSPLEQIFYTCVMKLARSTEEIKAILDEIGNLAQQAEADLDTVSRFAFVEVEE